MNRWTRAGPVPIVLASWMPLTDSDFLDDDVEVGQFALLLGW